jgi:hypothetical protein
MEGHNIVLNGIVINKRSTKLRNNAKSSSKTCHWVHEIMPEEAYTMQFGFLK